MFDFRNQDVTGDFYMFRASRYEREGIAVNSTTGRKQDSYTDEEVGSKSKTASRNEVAQNKSSRNTSSKSRNNVQYHKVVKGETVYSIAHKRGLTVEQLCKMNHIGKNMRIRPGQILKYS
jgi:LysM repeat protein